MYNIDIHADDYALTMHSSKDIIALLIDGCLDSISIMTNMSCFKEAMKLYEDNESKFAKKPLINVHLNFMEGHCVSPKEQVPLLVDNYGYFKLSWGNLFFSHSRELKEQLKIEIISQIDALCATPLMLKTNVRLDSHQHTHMTKIVFSAIEEAILEKSYNVTFIRNAQESPMLFLNKISVYPTLKIVNLIKEWLLYFRSLEMKKRLKKYNKENQGFCGLLFSGSMDNRVIKILPNIIKKANKKRMEVLFHPGSVLKEEIGTEFVKPGFVEFHLSEGRIIENQTVRALKLLI